VGGIKVRISKYNEKIYKSIYLFGFKRKKRGEGINNRNRETHNKGK
jgi:hypothetical protein